jgi:hypothetical protein
MTPDEVAYVKGYSPPTVMEDAAPDDIWQGKLVISTSDLDKKGKSAQDYRYWSYPMGDQSRIDVSFNPARTAVITVVCYSDSRYLNAVARCPPIANITDGVNEKYVIQRLGQPDTSRIDGVTKNMTYRKPGIDLWLVRGTEVGDG